MSPGYCAAPNFAATSRKIFFCPGPVNLNPDIEAGKCVMPSGGCSPRSKRGLHPTFQFSHPWLVREKQNPVQPCKRTTAEAGTRSRKILPAFFSAVLIGTFTFAFNGRSQTAVI